LIAFKTNEAFSNMPRKLWIAIVLAFLFASPAAAEGARPANSLDELWRELQACVKAPGGSPGSELTIFFALTRDGSLLGKPRITYSRLVGDADSQKRFVEAAIAALAKCLPLRMTEALGGAIAGRLLSIRVISRQKETDT
jgi:hypothetical protein